MIGKGAEIGFGNWVYTYALKLGLGTTITSAYITSAFWGTLTLGRLLGVWVSTRAWASTILFIDLFGCQPGPDLALAKLRSGVMDW